MRGPLSVAAGYFGRVLGIRRLTILRKKSDRGGGARGKKVGREEQPPTQKKCNEGFQRKRKGSVGGTVSADPPYMEEKPGWRYKAIAERTQVRVRREATR